MFIHSSIHSSSIHSFIDSFIHFSNYSSIHLLIHSSIHLFIYSFIHLFIHLFIYSFSHLFTCSFDHSFNNKYSSNINIFPGIDRSAAVMQKSINDSISNNNKNNNSNSNRGNKVLYQTQRLKTSKDWLEGVRCALQTRLQPIRSQRMITLYPITRHIGGKRWCHHLYRQPPPSITS